MCTGWPISSRTWVGLTWIWDVPQAVGLYCSCSAAQARQWNIPNPSQPNPVYDHLMGRPVDCECRNSQVKRSSSNINHLDNDKSCEYLFCCYWPLPSAFRSIHSNFCLFGSLVVFLSFSSRFPLYSTLHLACTYCFHTHPLGISSREGGGSSSDSVLLA